MLDFTEKVPSTKFPPVLSPDTQTEFDNLPGISAAEIEDFNLTHTREALLPYQETHPKLDEDAEPIYVQTDDEG